MIAMILALTAGAVELTTPDDSQEALSVALQAELARNTEDLSLPGAPKVYHLRYQLLILDQVDIEASLGSLVHIGTDPYNALGVELRIGDPHFDNTGFGGWQNGFDRAGLPVDVTDYSIHLDAWQISDRAYKEAVEQYARKTAQFTPPIEYPGDYTLTGKVEFREDPAEAGSAQELRDLAVRLSQGMRADLEPLERGSVFVGHEAGSLWTVDTEGTDVRRAVSETTFRAVAHHRADDGMLLTDHRLWTAKSPEGLPGEGQMLHDTQEMTSQLITLSMEPVLDEEYVGPVIFEDSAAIDLFRYLLIAQVEGTPAEVPFDSFFGELGADKDPIRIGRRVLPPGWTVHDDPLTDPGHPASFSHDWEGTPAEDVELVTDGIVRTVLMSRIPRKGIDGTNGHGRGFLAQKAEGRAAMMEVESPIQASTAKLRKKALKLAKAYGRDYILVVSRLQEPSIRAVGSSSFFYGLDEGSLPPPVSVTRIYADGTKPERLRGASFAGIQRFVLRDILAAGPQRTGTFMASTDGFGGLGPTEGMPTWLSAPDVLVGEVEIVPAPGDPQDVPILTPRR